MVCCTLTWKDNHWLKLKTLWQCFQKFSAAKASESVYMWVQLIVCLFIYSFRVYCLMGDGESAEGSIWEAMSFSSHYKLDNLVCIFDINRLGQSEPAPLQHDTETYAARARAFGYVKINLLFSSYGFCRKKKLGYCDTLVSSSQNFNLTL